MIRCVLTNSRTYNVVSFTCMFNGQCLYLQISNAEFSCPSWFSPGAMRLIRRILDPNPMTVSKV